MDNDISWFEIPSTDLERATKFYEAIIQVKHLPLDLPNLKMRMFPIHQPSKGIGSAIVESSGFHKPSGTESPLVYLNGNPDLQGLLDRVQAAGGSITVPKTE